MSADEHAVRQQIMSALEQHTALSGGFLTRDELSDFPIGGGSRRRLIDRARGIWNPRDLAATLSVVSSPKSRYADREVQGGLFHYSYREGSTQGDNRKLRRAWELDLPIILLRKIADGVYVPIFPVYVVGDDTAANEFVLALDETLHTFLIDPLNPTDAERRYAERVVKQRLHQPEFRGRVIRAYDVRCAVCKLEVGQLLDAAHILPDGHELGQPVVQNGLSMCKIHHAAYDEHLLGITPDYEVRLNSCCLTPLPSGRALAVTTSAVRRSTSTETSPLDATFRAWIESIDSASRPIRGLGSTSSSPIERSMTSSTSVST